MAARRGRDALGGSMRSTTARPGPVWWAEDARNEVVIGHIRLRGRAEKKQRAALIQRIRSYLLLFWKNGRYDDGW
jgi:hypothetical protein